MDADKIEMGDSGAGQCGFAVVNLGGIGRAPEVAAVLTAIEGLMR
jgi:hypothetical protein